MGQSIRTESKSVTIMTHQTIVIRQSSKMATSFLLPDFFSQKHMNRPISITSTGPQSYLQGVVSAEMKISSSLPSESRLCSGHTLDKFPSCCGCGRKKGPCPTSSHLVEDLRGNLNVYIYLFSTFKTLSLIICTVLPMECLLINGNLRLHGTFKTELIHFNSEQGNSQENTELNERSENYERD